MARPRRSAPVRRIELRLAGGDPLLEELTQEAERRGVELQQHIYDLLRGRYLLRRGESLATLLWLPGEAYAATSTQPESPQETVQPARESASAWIELLGSADP